MAVSYELVEASAWPTLRESLVDEHPLTDAEIVDLCHDTFSDILMTRIGHAGLRYIKDIPLPGDTFGVMFEALFLRRLQEKYVGSFRKGSQQSEADIVFIDNPRFSFEVKTTSKRIIYGPRSVKGIDESKKNGGAYHLNVYWNTQPYPSIGAIYWGWLDPCDFAVRKTGNYSPPLKREAQAMKMVRLFKNEYKDVVDEVKLAI